MHTTRPRPTRKAPPPDESQTAAVAAAPYAFAFDPATTALVIIDMQRDFLEPGGFGALLGNDVSLLLQRTSRRCRTCWPRPGPPG